MFGNIKICDYATAIKIFQASILSPKLFVRSGATYNPNLEYWRESLGQKDMKKIMTYLRQFAASGPGQQLMRGRYGKNLWIDIFLLSQISYLWFANAWEEGC